MNVLPHKVRVKTKAGDNVIVRMSELKKWVEDEDNGLAGEYGLAYVQDCSGIIASFSDVDSAFYFMFRWR